MDVGKIDFDVEYLEKLYYLDEENENKDIYIRNKVDRNFENMIEKFLEDGKVNIHVLAWKWGNQSIVEQIGNGKPQIYNGNRLIDSEKIMNTIEWINENEQNLKDLIRKDIGEAYELIRDNTRGIYFGPVYIINILYFLSSGEIPIYDRFAHKAVKALYLEKMPYEIYVGYPVDCNCTEEIMAMLNEYRWLLREKFGTDKINRKIDRALWVYGHMRKSKEE